MLVSEMGSEPEGRSCGFRLERLQRVQNKQTKLTWDIEFVTKGSSSHWKTCVCLVADFGLVRVNISRAEELPRGLRVPLSRILPEHCQPWRRE